MLESDNPLGLPSDAGRRASDVVTLALLADREGNVNRWVALRLSDGGSDGTVYDTPADAANAQLHYQLCAYVCIPPSGMNPREADAILKYHRLMYDAGNRPPYLDGWVPIVPNRIEAITDDHYRRSAHRFARPAGPAGPAGPRRG